MIWKMELFIGLTGLVLSDVTTAMQVQRGLGSSKLAMFLQLVVQLIL